MIAGRLSIDPVPEASPRTCSDRIGGRQALAVARGGSYLPRMRKHRTLILGLVLALFQIQVFAAATLGCLHAGGVDGPASVCPNHLLAKTQADAPTDLQADSGGPR